jgi:hypothetical protein
MTPPERRKDAAEELIHRLFMEADERVSKFLAALSEDAKE